MRSETVSDVETFLSVLLYADIQGKDFPKYLKKFVKKVGKNVVRDYILIKLLDYYYRRTRPDSPNEKLYLDIISDLRIRTQKLPQRMKLTIMKTIKDAKRSFDDDQHNS